MYGIHDPALLVVSICVMSVRGQIFRDFKAPMPDYCFSLCLMGFLCTSFVCIDTARDGAWSKQVQTKYVLG